MILMDVYEPEAIKNLIEQVVEVSQVPLNIHGFADYQWTACDGHTIQVERKQTDEILGGIDHVEEQLSREVVKADETILVCEGFPPEYVSFQMVRSWKRAKSGRVVVPHHEYHINYTGIEAWLYQLNQAGITTFHTFDFNHTARAIVAWYKSTQVAEHHTLRRYIKDEAYIPRKREKLDPGARNPQILNLMSIKGADIGEEKAKALIARFGTFWYACNQEIDTLAETMVGGKRFGEVGARKLLKCIGRIQ